jgi:hypothetical protein
VGATAEANTQAGPQSVTLVPSKSRAPDSDPRPRVIEYELFNLAMVPSLEPESRGSTIMAPPVAPLGDYLALPREIVYCIETHAGVPMLILRARDGDLAAALWVVKQRHGERRVRERNTMSVGTTCRSLREIATGSDFRSLAPNRPR